MPIKLNDQQKEFAGYLAQLLREPEGEVEAKQETVPQELVALHEWVTSNPKVPGADEVIHVASNRVEVVKRNATAIVPQEQGIGSLTAGLDRSIPFDVPLASIFAGGLGGLVLGDVIDGFAPPRTATRNLNLMNLGIKGIAIAAAFHPRFGKRWLGDRPAMVVGVVLAIGLLGDLLPIDRWVAQLTGQVARVLPGNQMRQTRQAQSPETTLPEYDTLAQLLNGRG